MQAVPAGYEKKCPTCGMVSPIDKAQCDGCGRVFKTQFVAQAPPPPREEKTVAVPRGWVPPPDTPTPPYHMPPPPYPQQPPPQYQQPPYAPIASGQRMIQKPAGTHPTGTAAIIGILLTGGGQMVNGQTMKGVVFLLIAIVIAWPTAFIGSVVVGVIALIDTVQIANRLYRGEAVGEWQFF